MNAGRGARGDARKRQQQEHTLGDWFRDSPEASALLAEESAELFKAELAAEHERANKAEAEVMNLEADYDGRGERLWRLAALAEHVPCESDNDATAELVVADALTEVARLKAERDEARAEVERLRLQVDLLAKQIGDHARHRHEWADWIDNAEASVGVGPLTPHGIAEAMRAEHPPFGRAAGRVEGGADDE